MLTFALGPKDVRVHVDDMASNMDYFCPTCGSPVIPRKGEVRRHHFAHKGGGSCADGWSRSYDDSEWHHLWQERFPKENQEVTLTLGQIRHRADVLAGTTVVEFQRSTLTPEQFNDRNTFYQDLGYKIVWLYDLRDTFREGGMCKEPREDGGLLFSWDDCFLERVPEPLAAGVVQVLQLLALLRQALDEAHLHVGGEAEPLQLRCLFRCVAQVPRNPHSDWDVLRAHEERLNLGGGSARVDEL